MVANKNTLKAEYPVHRLDELGSDRGKPTGGRLINGRGNPRGRGLSRDRPDSRHLSFDRQAQKCQPLVKNLRVIAQTGNERKFIETVRAVDWTPLPSWMWTRAIRLALEAGAHALACRLARDGVESHPEDPELQRYARLFAPATVRTSDDPPDPGVRANHSWLVNNDQGYRGRWVALKAGTLLADGSTLSDLLSRVDERKGILFTKVY